MDHYQCDLYFIPETRACWVWGLTELFPQHCQLPNLTPHQHLRVLTNELANSTTNASATTKGCRLFKLLKLNIQQIINPGVHLDKQRVSNCETQEQQQRVIDKTPILTVSRITNAPPILYAQNPTAKQALKSTPRLHNCETRNNTPRAVPLIQRTNTPTPAWRISPQKVAQGTPPPLTRISLPSCTHQCLVTQQAINVMTICKMATVGTIFTHPALISHAKTYHAPHFKHYASPMVHPVTGKTISSYKRLMKDPVTAEIWQTAFGKDFGGMAQGCNKTGEKGTNAMLVMTINEIAHALQAGTKFTYANLVINHRPQKEDPNRIWITAGGNLISYNSELSVCTADIKTSLEQCCEHGQGTVHVS
jgi:hypothetical protein